MCEQNASLVKHSKLVAKNMNKLSLKIVQKTLKWPLQYIYMQIFKNFSGQHAPGPPLESFLLLKLLKINSAVKTMLEKMTKIGAPFLKKILNTCLT